jgi:hypothetical protein
MCPRSGDDPIGDFVEVTLQHGTELLVLGPECLFDETARRASHERRSTLAATGH